MFIIPALKIDAVWDPIRTCVFLGTWYMASYLAQKGYEVWYSDEIIRENGLAKKRLFKRVLTGKEVSETGLDISYDDLQTHKLKDFRGLDNDSFIDKYSAFQNNTVTRIIARIGNPEEETLTEIEKIRPDVVGIPLISSANHIAATELAKCIKERFPQIKIVFGGQHVSALGKEFLTDKPYIDHIVVGSGFEALKMILDGEKAPQIINGAPIPMENYPLLDPGIIFHNRYPITPTHTYQTGGRRSVDFMFTEGCFRSCDFCFYPGCSGSNKIRYLPYDKVDKQLKIFKESGIEEIVVHDDAFLGDGKHRKDHLPKILGTMKKYGLFWQNNGGLDFELLDDEVTSIFTAYNRKGIGRITNLYIPFNPRNWNYGKSAILGTPLQTIDNYREELETDRELIQRGYINTAICFSATALFGSRWFDKYGHMIVNKEDYPGYSFFPTHHRTDFFGPREIEKLVINWLKTLDPVQKTYPWHVAFPNTSE
jgi:hypothetical protein